MCSVVYGILNGTNATGDKNILVFKIYSIQNLLTYSQNVFCLI